MASCASCLHKNVHPFVCSDCLGGTHFKPSNKTNADRIRSMTDEELAEWIISITEDITPNWLEWLKHEVSTNG